MQDAFFKQNVRARLRRQKNTLKDEIIVKHPQRWSKQQNGWDINGFIFHLADDSPKLHHPSMRTWQPCPEARHRVAGTRLLSCPPRALSAHVAGMDAPDRGRWLAFLAVLPSNHPGFHLEQQDPNQPPGTQGLVWSTSQDEGSGEGAAGLCLAGWICPALCFFWH